MRATLLLLALLALCSGVAHSAELSSSATLVEVSADRRSAVLWDGSEVAVWRLSPEKLRFHWVTQGTPRWLRFSSDHSFLIVGLEENRVEAWSLDGRRLWSLDAVADWPALVSPDGGSVVLPSPDRRSLRFYEARGGRLQRVLKLHGRLSDATWSPQGPLLIATAEENMETWQPSGRRLEIARSAGARNLLFSPDGRFLAVAMKDDVRVFSTRDWKITTDIHGPTWKLTPLAFSPDGSYLALSHFKPPTEYGVSLREMPSAHILRFQTMSDAPHADFAPAGHSVVISSDQASIYRLVDGDPSWSGPSSPVRAAWFVTSDRRLLLWNEDGALQLLDY